MFDVSKYFYDILNAGWANNAQLLDSNVEPVESDSVDIKLLSTDFEPTSAYKYNATSMIGVICVVRRSVGYKEKLNALVEYVVAKLLSSPAFYQKFGTKSAFEISYSYDDKGDSNYALGAIKFNVSYVDQVITVESGAVPVVPLTSVIGGIDNGNPDLLIDAYFRK